MKLGYCAFAMIFIIMSAHSTERLQGKREIVLNNPDVEVVRLTYPPGSESGMHTHQYHHRVVYFVSGGKLKLIPEDNSADPRTLDVVDGQTLYLPATTHNVINIGDTEVIIVETELKN